MTGAEWLQAVLVIFGGGGLVGGITAWWTIKKLKADTTKTEVDAIIAVESAEDRHLLTIIENQSQHLVNPLREEVGVLRAEVGDLQKALREINSRYWRLVEWSRAMIVWARLYHDAEEGKPPHPTLPTEVDAFFH